MPLGRSARWTLLLLALFGAGCRNVWHEPRPMKLVALCAPKARHCAPSAPLCAGATAHCEIPAACDPSIALESARALAWQATLAERSCNHQATDLHFQAAMAAWSALEQLDAT